jgi:Peptidase A4 family
VVQLKPAPGASFNGSDAEWIMEASDGGEPISSLPSFSPVQFTTALAGNSSITDNPQNGDYVNIIGFGQQLTLVTVGNDAVTIDFIG